MTRISEHMSERQASEPTGPVANVISGIDDPEIGKVNDNVVSCRHNLSLLLIRFIPLFFITCPLLAAAGLYKYVEPSGWPSATGIHCLVGALVLACLSSLLLYSSVLRKNDETRGHAEVEHMRTFLDEGPSPPGQISKDGGLGFASDVGHLCHDGMNKYLVQHVVKCTWTRTGCALLVVLQIVLNGAGICHRYFVVPGRDHTQAYNFSNYLVAALEFYLFLVLLVVVVCCVCFYIPDVVKLDWDVAKREGGDAKRHAEAKAYAKGHLRDLCSGCNYVAILLGFNLTGDNLIQLLGSFSVLKPLPACLPGAILSSLAPSHAYYEELFKSPKSYFFLSYFFSAADLVLRILLLGLSSTSLLLKLVLVSRVLVDHDGEQVTWNRWSLYDMITLASTINQLGNIRQAETVELSAVLRSLFAGHDGVFQAPDLMQTRFYLGAIAGRFFSQQVPAGSKVASRGFIKSRLAGCVMLLTFDAYDLQRLKIWPRNKDKNLKDIRDRNGIRGSTAFQILSSLYSNESSIRQVAKSAGESVQQAVEKDVESFTQFADSPKLSLRQVASEDKAGSATLSLQSTIGRNVDTPKEKGGLLISEVAMRPSPSHPSIFPSTPFVDTGGSSTCETMGKEQSESRVFNSMSMNTAESGAEPSNTPKKKKKVRRRTIQKEAAPNLVSAGSLMLEEDDVLVSGRAEQVSHGHARDFQSGWELGEDREIPAENTTLDDEWLTPGISSDNAIPQEENQRPRTSESAGLSSLLHKRPRGSDATANSRVPQMLL